MKILMVSHGYPPTVSGVTLVVQKLSRALVRRGHQVMVVTASERGVAYTDEDEKVKLERVRSFPNPFWREGPVPWASLGTLRAVIDRFQPDVIHTHENALLSFQLLRLDRSLEAPRVSSCYFLPRYVTHYLSWGSPIKRAIESAIWKYAISNLNQYDHVIFSTHTQQQGFIQHGLRVPSLAISNGVDSRRYYPLNGQMEGIELHYSLPPRPRILFVGRLMKDKKIDLLIQAMKRVCSFTDAHLLVVGRGSERGYLETLALNLGLQRNIHLLGYVPESDLPAIYRCSDLFAIASVVEVQSIPVLQAVASGLPVVAVNAAALPELVRTGVNGILVKPDDPEGLGDALLQLIGDPVQSKVMGRASLSLAQHHAESETFLAYERFYESITTV